jgi:hypothetical protein
MIDAKLFPLGARSGFVLCQGLFEGLPHQISQAGGLDDLDMSAEGEDEVDGFEVDRNAEAHLNAPVFQGP